MKKVYSLLTLVLIALSTQVYAQVAGSFDVITMKWRWNAETVEYLDNTGFITGARIMGHKEIYGSGDNSRANLESVRAWLTNEYPSYSSTGYLIVSWETGPYVDMKNYSETSTRFKEAESEILRLLTEIKRVRPYVKVSMYMMPFRFWLQSQNESYNGTNKFDKIIAKVDFIAPSYYMLKADEEVGHERNLQYIRENLNVALTYGKKFNKPVIPFMWHRIHPTTSDYYDREIIQKEVYAKYIKYIATYSYNNYKAAGVWWYDNVNGHLSDLSGIKNHLQGTVYDKETYNTMVTNHAKQVKDVLTNSTTSSTTQKVVSYTLINADTQKDIQTLTSGSTLNLANLPTKNLDIRANTNPGTVGSVKFYLSGQQTKSVTESLGPYELMGDNGAWTPAVGSYTLKATPYSSSKGSGTAGTALTINFDVVNSTTTSTTSSSTTQQVVSFTLINADTDTDIQTIASGSTLNLATLPTKNLNIRANTNPEKVGSVKFVLSGAQSHSKIESGAPYALYSDQSGNYNAWTPALGSYTLKATPYSASSGSGTAGTSLTVSFSVVNKTSSTAALSTETEMYTGSSTTASVAVYPNPVTTMLTVKASQAGAGVSVIRLYDLVGVLVLTKEVTTTAAGLDTVLDVSSLKQGQYILIVNSAKDLLIRQHIRVE